VAAPIVSGNELTAILFDYGGTLDGDAQHWFDHFVRLYAEAGADVPYAALKDAFYTADDALGGLPDIRTFDLDRTLRTHVELQMRRLRRDDSPLARRLADAFIADTRAAWDRNRPLLRSLADRFRLGVVSNNYGNLPTLLDEAALAPFAVVLDSSLVGVAKPDRAIYELAAGRLDVVPSSVLHVGDSWERDVVPADAVGMRTAWLARPDAATPAAPPNVWRIASLLELEALLA
jgi:5'-nucleotidase